jgi:ParB family chromosome partitioning protein
MAKKSGLGMGLDVLFDDNKHITGDNVTTIRLSQIEPNRAQPRKFFDEEKLTSLAESIKSSGLLQPIIVKSIADGRYKIVAGERRYRACKSLGMAEIPAIIRDFDDVKAAEAALIENIVREDLNPIEEAAGLRELTEVFGLTQEQAAKAVGKPRSGVANSLRLLGLPGEVQGLLIDGRLSAGHGKVLAGMEDSETALVLALQAADGNMTVRELEQAVKDISEKVQDNNTKTVKKTISGNTFYTETALALKEMLGRKVQISASKNGKKGKITLEFSGEDDLRSIAAVLENLI